MKKIVTTLLTLLPLFAVEPVVSPQWLKANLDRVVILDVSEPKVYAKGHIPGAINAPISLWRQSRGSFSLLIDDTQLQTLIQNLGIDKESHVVLYAHHSGKDLLKTSYTAWALEYAGVTKSSLLEGGYKAWEKAGFEVSQAIPKKDKSRFTITPNDSLVADKKYVRKSIGKVRMLDARPAIYYFGAKKQSVLARAGHIPKASSYFWRYSFENDKFKSKNTLKEMLIDGLEIEPKKEVIVYCTGGLETSMNWFVLHRILRLAHVRLYDASMKEWANDPDTPLVKYRWE